MATLRQHGPMGPGRAGGPGTVLPVCCHKYDFLFVIFRHVSNKIREDDYINIVFLTNFIRNITKFTNYYENKIIVVATRSQDGPPGPGVQDPGEQLLNRAFVWDSSRAASALHRVAVNNYFTSVTYNREFRHISNMIRKQNYY